MGEPTSHEKHGVTAEEYVKLLARDNSERCGKAHRVTGEPCVLDASHEGDHHHTVFGRVVCSHCETGVPEWEVAVSREGRDVLLCLDCGVMEALAERYP